MTEPATVRALYDDYMTNVYGPEGVPKHQELEVRQAFLAGATCFMSGIIIPLSELEEEEAVSALESRRQELEELSRALVDEAKAFLRGEARE